MRFTSLKFVFIFLILATSTDFSQTKKCSECGKVLGSTYVEVEGKYYHKHHFLCSFCKKPIEGVFTKYDGKYYHRNCYLENVLPKCDVCGEPLEGSYIRDSYGNQYHSDHLTELEKCDNCDRLICDNITSGGRRFSDGRSLCNICLKDAVWDEVTIRHLLRMVDSRLRNFGLYVDLRNVSITGTDKKKLLEVAGNSFSTKSRGFCKITTETIRYNGRTTETDNYEIFVLDHVPALYIEATIAHELMHVWIHQNTEIDHSNILEEGSCQYISYLYLSELKNNTAEKIIEFMMNDQNEIYGNGFRNVYGKFKEKYLIELLNYLKQNEDM
ncbi:MAG: protein DA1 [Melioribacteraceae bacterium]|nr:protein DA1 [Melioribacteraceae bacterium]